MLVAAGDDGLLARGSDNDGSLMVHTINLSLLMFSMLSVCALRSDRVSPIGRTICISLVLHIR